MREKTQINFRVTYKDVEKLSHKISVGKNQLYKLSNCYLKDNNNCVKKRPVQFLVLTTSLSDQSKKLLLFNLRGQTYLCEKVPEFTSSFVLTIKPLQKYKRFEPFTLTVWFDILKNT